MQVEKCSDPPNPPKKSKKHHLTGAETEELKTKQNKTKKKSMCVGYISSGLNE